MRKILIGLAAMTVALSCVTFALEVSGHFALKRAMVNGEPLSNDEAANLGLRIGESVFQQDCEVAAAVMCRREGIGSADITIQLPDKILITTNNFDSDLLVYDAAGMRLLGLDDRQSVTPIPPSIAEYIGPTLHGLQDLKLYEKPSDFRVASVARDLEALKQEHLQWFMSICEIDFSQSDCLRISVDRFAFVTLAPADDLLLSLETLFRMADGSPEALENASSVDLRFTGQIVITPKVKS